MHAIARYLFIQKVIFMNYFHNDTTLINQRIYIVGKQYGNLLFLFSDHMKAILDDSVSNEY
jgi:hypothetical protein